MERAGRRLAATMLVAGVLALTSCGDPEPTVGGTADAAPKVPIETRTAPPPSPSTSAGDTGTSAPTPEEPATAPPATPDTPTTPAAAVTSDPPAPAPSTGDTVPATMQVPTAPAANDGSGGQPFDLQVSGCGGTVTVAFPITPADGDLATARGSFPPGTDLTLKTLSSGDSFLNFACAKLPAGSPFNAAGGIKGAVDGSATSTGGKVTRYTPTTIQGKQGATAEITAKGVVFYMQVVADQGRLTFVQGTPKGYFDRFVASWKIS